MQICKAICRDCRYSHVHGDWDRWWNCYANMDYRIDCITGVRHIINVWNCNRKNRNGDCEDFEHRPKKPTKPWYMFWIDYKWDVKLQKWV